MPAVTPVNWMSMLQNFAPLPSLLGSVHTLEGEFWVLVLGAGSHAAITFVVGPTGIADCQPFCPAVNCWLAKNAWPPPFVPVHGDMLPGVPPAQPSAAPHVPGCPDPDDCPWIQGKLVVLPKPYRVAPPTCNSTFGRSPGCAAGSQTMMARSPALGHTNWSHVVGLTPVHRHAVAVTWMPVSVPV